MVTVANKNKNFVLELVSEELHALHQRGIPLKQHAGAHHKQRDTDHGQRAVRALCVIAGGLCSVLQRRDKHVEEWTREVFPTSPDDLAGKNEARFAWRSRCLISQGHTSAFSFAKNKTFSCLFCCCAFRACFAKKMMEGVKKRRRKRKKDKHRLPAGPQDGGFSRLSTLSYYILYRLS